MQRLLQASVSSASQGLLRRANASQSAHRPSCRVPALHARSLAPLVCLMATKGAYTYSYPRPGLTVDCAIVSEPGKEPAQLLLIRRKHDPFQARLPQAPVKSHTACDARTLTDRHA